MANAGQFQNGQVANPKGRPKKDRAFTDALRRALSQEDPKTGAKMMKSVAWAVVSAAAEGDMTAAKLIGDRLEGKPGQEVEVNHRGSIFVEGLRQLDRERDMKVIEHGENDAGSTSALPSPDSLRDQARAKK